MPDRARGGARALLLLLATVLLACSGDATGPGGSDGLPPGRPVLPQTYRPSGHAAAGDVFAELFMWKWTDVASECEDVLRPSGYRAALVSPPEEHIVTSGYPWWEVYQPVSYSIDRSRSGTRAEFVDMVNRCRAAGVDIYADAVINHMTAGSGTGSNGTVYTKYNYPGLYTQSDFHTPCAVTNYQDAANVQDCELLGLADLNTGLASVRQKIAGYLIGLAELGVAGFRIDAAKHIQPVELDSILGIVDRTLTGEGRPVPYYFGEVSDYGGEAVHAADYFGLAYSSGGAADITEFKFRGVGDKFLGTGGQKLADLDPGGPAGAQFSAQAWGLMPSNKAVVFLDNHDTQRSDGISYRDGNTYRLAAVWMLAQPYGYPSVMSSFAFDRSTQAGRDAGPPSDASGQTLGVACAPRIETAVVGQWVCEQRDPAIAAMVGFRRYVAGTDFANFSSDGANVIAFGRGDKGFVAINREAAAYHLLAATGLVAGTYCDLLTGGRSGNTCAGASVVVDTQGRIDYSLGANTAIAIDGASKL